MTEERITPLRARMIEDMRIRGLGDKAQKAHIRAIKDFAAILGRSPDTATPEELRAYQLHMIDTGIGIPTFNSRIVALRFFFSMTCGREDMKRHMQFRRAPKTLPVVLSSEAVLAYLAALDVPEDWDGELVLETRGYSVRLESIALVEGAELIYGPSFILRGLEKLELEVVSA